MIGHEGIIRGRLGNKRTPTSIFVHLAKDQEEFERMIHPSSSLIINAMYKELEWLPDVVISPKDYTSTCDFRFLNGLQVQAHLGDDYTIGFKWVLAITECEPKQLLAVMGIDEEFLFWTKENGFRQTEVRGQL